MPLFTSDRERRLWIGAALVLALVASTLGPAQVVAAELRARGLLTLTMQGVLVVGAAVFAWRWMRTRPGWGEAGVVFGVVFAFLWMWARVETPEERTHLIEYAVLAVLVHRALVERARNRGATVPARRDASPTAPAPLPPSHGRVRRSAPPAAVAVVACILVGWLDEAAQAVIPGRFYDLRDVGFNVLAVLMGVGGSAGVGWARRWRQQRREAR